MRSKFARLSLALGLATLGMFAEVPVADAA
jgi:hypothetical protein